MSLEIRIVNDDSDPLIEFVHTTLRSFNRSANAEFWAVAADPANKEQPLLVSATDETGTLVGGLVGETFLKWLKIDKLSVAESSRGQGIGTMLMQEAEREAIKRHCRYAFLDTMSYQAPAFYEKLGYREIGRIDDWDSHGHTKHYFVKELLTRTL